MARIRKKTLCSTISLRRTLRSPKSRVTRLGERDCNGERDRMDAGTLMDCDWVTGAPVHYDSTSPGYPGVEAHYDRTALAGLDETRKRGCLRGASKEYGSARSQTGAWLPWRLCASIRWGRGGGVVVS